MISTPPTQKRGAETNLMMFFPYTMYYLLRRNKKDIYIIPYTVYQYYTPPKFNSSPLKKGGEGRRSFPIGMVTSSAEVLNPLQFAMALMGCPFGVCLR